MRFNNSRSIDDSYYQTEEYCLDLDEEKKQIQFQKFLVRYGPGDGYEAVSDDVMTLAEFEQNKDQQGIMLAWFGERVSDEVMAKVRLLLAS